jgi:hypothetical protein
LTQASDRSAGEGFYAGLDELRRTPFASAEALTSISRTARP